MKFVVILLMLISQTSPNSLQKINFDNSLPHGWKKASQISEIFIAFVAEKRSHFL